jgi:hypothetical protein
VVAVCAIAGLAIAPAHRKTFDVKFSPISTRTDRQGVSHIRGYIYVTFNFKRGCVPGRVVRLFEARPGPDRLRDTDRTDPKGRYNLSLPGRLEGRRLVFRFTRKVDLREGGHFHVCQAQRFSIYRPRPTPDPEPEPEPAPANDNFGSAQSLSGERATVYGDNTSATKQPGEPNHAGNQGGASVWWRFIAPRSGTYTIHTCSTAFNTLLAVYTGAGVGSLTQIASNDDVGNCGAFGGTSYLQFEAIGGTTYHLAVDGKYVSGRPLQGPIQIEVYPPAAP